MSQRRTEHLIVRELARIAHALEQLTPRTGGRREIRVLLGPVRDLRRTEVPTTPFKLYPKQEVDLTLSFPDASGKDESADVDPAAISYSADSALVAVVVDPATGNAKVQSGDALGSVHVTINATDRQGTVLPTVVQEFDVVERAVEPVAIVVSIGTPRDIA